MVNIVSIRIEGFDAKNFIANFEKEYPIEMKRYILKEVAENVADRIRKRMPEASGALKRSLSINPISMGWAINIDSPYASLLEDGFKPHWVSQELISAHLSGLDTTFRTYRSLGTLRGGKRLSAGVFRKLGPPILSTSKHQGFIMNAIISADRDIDNILSRKTDEAIKRFATTAGGNLKRKFTK